MRVAAVCVAAAAAAGTRQLRHHYYYCRVARVYFVDIQLRACSHAAAKPPHARVHSSSSRGQLVLLGLTGALDHRPRARDDAMEIYGQCRRTATHMHTHTITCLLQVYAMLKHCFACLIIYSPAGARTNVECCVKCCASSFIMCGLYRTNGEPLR